MQRNQVSSRRGTDNIGQPRDSLLLLYVNNKGADQPVHLRSLVSTFVIRSQYSTLRNHATCNISIMLIFSVVEQAGLSLTWSYQPLKTRSSTAHINLLSYIGQIIYNPGKG